MKDLQRGEALESGRQGLAVKLLSPAKGLTPRWAVVVTMRYARESSAPAWPGDLGKTELFPGLSSFWTELVVP